MVRHTIVALEESLPDYAPVVLGVAGLGSTTASVNVRVSPLERRGVIGQISAKCTAVSNTAAREVTGSVQTGWTEALQFANMGSTSFQLPLAKLEPYVEYVCQLFTWSSLGKSLASSQVLFRTLEGKPSRPAAPVVLINPRSDSASTAQSLLVSWQPPAIPGGPYVL